MSEKIKNVVLLRNIMFVGGGAVSTPVGVYATAKQCEAAAIADEAALAGIGDGFKRVLAALGVASLNYHGMSIEQDEQSELIAPPRSLLLVP